jgi:hypothetical protein
MGFDGGIGGPVTATSGRANMKEFITGNYVANAVRMKRSLHQGAFLIVEGGADATLFNNFIDHEDCRIEIGFGKHNVISAVVILNKDDRAGVLGIADSDFRNILPDSVVEANLLFTDDHDLDCMVLRSRSLDRLIAEFGVESRVEAFSKNYGPLVGYTIARSASALGYLLLISLVNDHGLVFDGLPFSRFIDPVTLHTDLDAMLVEVKNKSQKHNLDWLAIKQEVLSMLEIGHDPWQVCCGHHVIEILSVAFRYTFASYKRGELTPLVLGKCLRLAYDVEEFVTTELFRSIRKWENDSTGFMILRKEVTNN